MIVYKLQYKDKETAIADLIAKNVYNEDFSFGKGIHAIVEIGLIAKTTGTYDEKGIAIVEPVFYDAYFFDVMSEEKIYFENEIFPANCLHSFAGYNTEEQK